MARLRWTIVAAGAAMASMSMASAEDAGDAPLPTVTRADAGDGMLSIMTYNVEGLPWPVATGRSAKLEQIAQRLHDLRVRGVNPHVVLLQESFSGDARAIGRRAGYPYMVSGMSADAPTIAPMSAQDRAFAARARWAKGEDMGKFLGSGLEILSDYPIVGVRRMAYPAFACAGYDCLANKGALLASIAVPGIATPVDIVTTHLNSRHASGVPDSRSLYAYRRQAAFLSDFIRSVHDTGRPLVVAGDFNVSAPARRAALLSNVITRWTAAGPIRDALHQAAAQNIALSADARQSMAHARDWEFFAPGEKAALRLRRIDVPFGHAADGSMLSDHIGYSATYSLAPVAAAATQATMTGRSKA